MYPKTKTVGSCILGTKTLGILNFCIQYCVVLSKYSTIWNAIAISKIKSRWKIFNVTKFFISPNDFLHIFSQLSNSSVNDIFLLFCKASDWHLQCYDACFTLFLYSSSVFGQMLWTQKSVDTQFCLLCVLIQVRKHSKHCRSCDKCVDGFDHHCRVLYLILSYSFSFLHLLYFC
jgi:hypothetical protein